MLTSICQVPGDVGSEFVRESNHSADQIRSADTPSYAFGAVALLRFAINDCSDKQSYAFRTVALLRFTINDCSDKQSYAFRTVALSVLP